MVTPSPTASLQNGILTLSFPDATPPSFWQIAPGDFSMVGFAVRGAGQAHEIVLTADADTPRVLAQYNNGGAAQDALAIILKAVQGRGATCATPSRTGGFFRALLRWSLRLIFLGLLLWVGFMLWTIFGPTSRAPGPAPMPAPLAQSSSPESETPASVAAPAPTGVPLSADDVLGE